MASKINIDLTALNALTSRVIGEIRAKAYVRAAAVSLTGDLRYRIHVLGLASDGNTIGTYSKGYLAYRVAKLKRGGSPKVILSATSQMENDLSPIPIGNGNWGVGYKNSFNAEKMDENEKRFDKSIISPTKEEIDQTIFVIQRGINAIVQQ